MSGFLTQQSGLLNFLWWVIRVNLVIQVKTSSVIAKVEYCNDGYLRSGNVDYSLDVFGNAAAMDVFKFLSLALTENLTVLDGFEKQDQELKN